MITALLLAAVVGGQVKDDAAAAKKAPAAVKAPTKAQAQAQSVLNARKARRAKSNQRRSTREAQEQVDYAQQLADQQKAIAAYQAYVVKMGPIWAAENANAIQQQRNGLLAEQNRIMSADAQNRAWLLYQLRTR